MFPSNSLFPKDFGFEPPETALSGLPPNVFIQFWRRKYQKVVEKVGDDGGQGVGRF